jgi:hypothetical protein
MPRQTWDLHNNRRSHKAVVIRVKIECHDVTELHLLEFHYYVSCHVMSYSDRLDHDGVLSYKIIDNCMSVSCYSVLRSENSIFHGVKCHYVNESYIMLECAMIYYVSYAVIG